MSKTNGNWRWVTVGVALAAGLALPGGGLAAPAALMGAGSLTTSLACIACAGAGLFSIITGSGLAALLWTQAGFAASLACVSACHMALTT